MIFGTDLGALAESVYLGIPYTDNYRVPDILVNPEHTTYIVGKTVIINRFSYPQNKIIELVRNNNKVICRVFFDIPGINFDPYLPKLNMNIMWNGEILETLGEENIETQRIIYSKDSEVLYFPRVKNYRDKPGLKGEYNFIGYLLYQVGTNLYNDFGFINLDVVKCMKGIF